jgi:aminoglycoside 6'-N-acetyltransferase
MRHEPETGRSQSIGQVRLDPFDPDRDRELVAGWLRAPHVARWWGDPDKALREIVQRPAGGGDALIVADDVPVGYVRWQTPTRAELDEAGLHEIPGDAVDIDIAIGDEGYVGRGVGPRALRRLVDRLLGQGRAPMVILATEVENTAAVRAYEKAGFRRRRRFDDPECGPCWLLVFGAGADADTGAGAGVSS